MSGSDHHHRCGIPFRRVEIYLDESEACEGRFVSVAVKKKKVRGPFPAPFGAFSRPFQSVGQWVIQIWER